MKPSKILENFIQQIPPTTKFVKPIKIKKTHTVSEIRHITEEKLNDILGRSGELQLTKIIRKPIPKPSKKRFPLRPPLKNDIPKRLANAITSLKLLDEPSIENRMKIFIGYCKYRNLSYNTTKSYIQILKRHNIFGNLNEQDDDNDNNNNDDFTMKDNEPQTVDLKPNKITFIDSGNIHTRIVSMKSFKLFATYINENLSQYNAPIAIALYTGLRTSEILQFSTYTLYQLLDRQEIIAIKRKQTVFSSLNPEPIYYQPVYNTHLNAFINRLANEIFEDEYKSFLQTKINIKLFPVTPKTLGNRIKALYFNATGEQAPFGFGIHSCRNMISMLMAEKSENILAIQTFLQHKNVKTTRQYIKADYTYTTNEFNRLTREEFKNVYDRLTDGTNEKEG